MVPGIGGPFLVGQCVDLSNSNQNIAGIGKVESGLRFYNDLGALTAGTVVYPNGYHTLGRLVEKADGDASGKGPAYVVAEDVADATVGMMVERGVIRVANFDTSGSTVGADVFSSGTQGALTLTNSGGLPIVGSVASPLSTSGYVAFDIPGERANGGISGTLYAPNGSAAAPSWTFASDPDLGVYRVSANLLGITANGAVVAEFGTTGLLTNTIMPITQTTGAFSVAVQDNLADAFSIKEASSYYLTVVTTNGTESVNVLKALKVDAIQGLTGTTGTFVVSLTDNLASALAFKEGSNPYLVFVTTDGSESVNVVTTLKVDTIAERTSTVGVTIDGVGLRDGSVQYGVGASTAAAGTTTADAGVLPAGTAGVYLTTGADDTAGVRITATDKVLGRQLHIANGVSNKILKVYPASGGTINGAAADAAYSSSRGSSVIVVCTSTAGSGAWSASG